MQTLDLTLAAGETRTLSIPAKYFRIISCLNPISVDFVRAGSVVDTASGVDSGYYDMPDGGFHALRITSATAQSMKLAVSNGSGGYDHTAGSVAITNVNGAFAQSAKVVTNASGQMLAANAVRRYLLIQNNDASGDIFVTLDGSAATAGNGIKIKAGGSYELQGFVCTGAINAIGSIASNANIVVVEG